MWSIDFTGQHRATNSHRAVGVIKKPTNWSLCPAAGIVQCPPLELSDFDKEGRGRGGVVTNLRLEKDGWSERDLLKSTTGKHNSECHSRRFHS